VRTRREGRARNARTRAHTLSDGSGVQPSRPRSTEADAGVGTTKSSRAPASRARSSFAASSSVKIPRPRNAGSVARCTGIPASTSSPPIDIRRNEIAAEPTTAPSSSASSTDAGATGFRAYSHSSSASAGRSPQTRSCRSASSASRSAPSTTITASRYRAPG
jgi:hypothetical protein